MLRGHTPLQGDGYHHLMVGGNLLVAGPTVQWVTSCTSATSDTSETSFTSIIVNNSGFTINSTYISSIININIVGVNNNIISTNNCGVNINFIITNNTRVLFLVVILGLI